METATLPVNLRKQDASPAAIALAADYAVTVADGYLGLWAAHSARAATPAPPRPLAGVRVLEIGPGATLGIPVLLACAGARVTVGDRFPAYWDPDFQPLFFRALLERVEPRGPDFTAPLRRLLAAGAFTPDVIESYDTGAEHIARIGRMFDLVLSNAVLEHVENLQVAVANIACVMAPGAIGFHQVDFRDHHHFDNPLEYLTIPRDEFAEERRAQFCERGATWRVSDVAAAFEDAGLVVRPHVNLRTTPEYLAGIRPRLQPEFAALPDEELLATSALFVTARGAEALRP
jgi:hypothetical protein